MVDIAISPTGIERFRPAGVGGTLHLAALADRCGIDQITIGEHLVITDRSAAEYPGTFPVPLDHAWYEPIALLSAVSAVTTRIRLSTSILLGALRPAVLLAKQLATLDQLSRGRLDLAVGVGWQRAEYEMLGVPWEGRFGRLDDHVRACRALWEHAPASYSGTTVSFSGAYCLPLPYQRHIPVCYGVSPTERNIARLADLADGWVLTTSLTHEVEDIAANVDRIKAALIAKGRDPDAFSVRLTVHPVMDGDGRPDLDATGDAIPGLVKAGVTTVALWPAAFCRSGDDLEEVLTRMASMKDRE